MAKRKQSVDPFLVNGFEDVESWNRWPTVQEYLDDWRARLNDIVNGFKNETPRSVRGKQAIDAKDALVQVEILERINNPTMLLEATVKLGILFERMSLRPFEPWIGRAPRVSKAAVLKGESTDRLKDNWPKVREFIQKRPTGVSELERCRQTSTHLLKGTLPGLPSVKVEITPGSAKANDRTSGHVAETLSVSPSCGIVG